jgi:hypothetical protein
MKMRNQISFIVGNTYQEIPRNAAKLDRCGNYLKIHDWHLYVDVIEGNPDILHKVTFDLGETFSPSSYVCHSPIPIKQHGSTFWRFQTRQQSYGPVPATLVILGAGGTRCEVQYDIVCHSNGGSARRQNFFERKEPRKIGVRKLPPGQRFGIELELSSMENLDQIASVLNQRIRQTTFHVINNYGKGKHTMEEWKLVPDRSIVCSNSQPNCNTFELVSPILTGGSGLNQVYRIIDTLKKNAEITVNKSMGFHVHVDVSSLSIEQLVKVCQNFIKYEDAIDSFLPPSRRTGSSESDSYFKSNRDAISFSSSNSNRERHQALAKCQDVHALASMMNPEGRYFKLNLQNLVQGRQSTLEFRQHSATTDYPKVSAWVRFCVALVQHSAYVASPTSFKPGRSLDYQFDAMFHYVVKDRALRDFYRVRAAELRAGQPSCCSGCAHGSMCTAIQ